MKIITNHVEWYHRYFSNKCTYCTDTGLLSRRAYVQTYFMMDKSPGIIMVMISCRTQRLQLVEKLVFGYMWWTRVKNYKHERHDTTCTQMNVIFTYANRFRHAGGMSCVDFYDKIVRKGVLTQKTLFTRTRTKKESRWSITIDNFHYIQDDDINNA